MALLKSTIVNGDLAVTGDIMNVPQEFIVDSTDTSAFSKVLDAYKKQKVIFLRYDTPDNIKSMMVPLVQAEESSGTINKFIFAKSREFETEYIGCMEMWTCTATSQTPVKTWSYVANTDYTQEATNTTEAGSAPSCTTAATAVMCSGNTSTATRAMYDADGNTISIYYASKSMFMSHLAWMWVLNSTYMKIKPDGDLLSSGTLEGTARIIDYAVKETRNINTGLGACPIEIHILSSTLGQVCPGYAGGITNAFEWPQHVRYRIYYTNIGSSVVGLTLQAGGNWDSSASHSTSKCFHGNIYADGTLQQTDDFITPIYEWRSGYVNELSICTLQPNQSKIWDIWWEKQQLTSDGYYTHTVYLTTIK